MALPRPVRVAALCLQAQLGAKRRRCLAVSAPARRGGEGRQHHLCDVSSPFTYLRLFYLCRVLRACALSASDGLAVLARPFYCERSGCAGMHRTARSAASFRLRNLYAKIHSTY